MLEENNMNVECRSFGYKNGIDGSSDFIFDVRCLPNPYYIDELKNKTGLDKSVRDYVLKFEQSRNYLEKITDFISFLIPIYKEKGKEKIVISFGCTGGHHRSVTFAFAVCEKLKASGINAVCFHRDINLKD